MNKYQTFTLALFTGLLSLAFISNASAEEWKREISLGFNQSTGNTEKTQLNVTGMINKSFEHAEFSSKAEIYYAATDDVMDTQKWNSNSRYAYDFGEEYRWFNSYTLDVDHDRFADIDYRILPGIGLGYWINRDDDFTWSVEGSAGYEITNYRSNRDDDQDPAIIARTFLKKSLFESSMISEDLKIIPSLASNGGTRIKSITEFTNPLREGLDLSLKYIIEHDTEPSSGKKKTDTIFIAGIKYAF